MTQQRLDWSAVEPSALVVAPSVHPQARETSAIAAVINAPDRATQSARILRLITEAGEVGMSDCEIERATGYSRATICARRGFDLRPFLVPASRRDVSPSGRPLTCWRRKTADEMEAGS